jgi:hypothetical protein
MFITNACVIVNNSLIYMAIIEMIKRMGVRGHA